MDKPLLDAFAYSEPSAAVRRASVLAMRARARLLRYVPSNRKPTFTADLPRIRSYPDGFSIAELGTQPVPGLGGCPVRHTADSSA